VNNPVCRIGIYLYTVNSRTRTISVACYILLLLRVLFIHYVIIAVTIPSQLLYYYFRPSSKLTFHRIPWTPFSLCAVLYNTGKSRRSDVENRKPFFFFFLLQRAMCYCIIQTLHIILLHFYIIVHNNKHAGKRYTTLYYHRTCTHYII